MSYDARLARYANVSTALALLSDGRLREQVEHASILRTGIGGTTALMQIETTSIFVKMIPLTELEKHVVCPVPVAEVGSNLEGYV